MRAPYSSQLSSRPWGSFAETDVRVGSFLTAACMYVSAGARLPGVMRAVGFISAGWASRVANEWSIPLTVTLLRSNGTNVTGLDCVASDAREGMTRRTGLMAFSCAWWLFARTSPHEVPAGGGFAAQASAP